MAKRRKRKGSRAPLYWFFIIAIGGIAAWHYREKLNLPEPPKQVLEVLAMHTNFIPSLPPTVVTQVPPPVVTNIATKPESQPETPPIRPAKRFDIRKVRNVMEAQVALARRGISCGPIDGAIGSQTRSALDAFQRSEKIPVTGQLDADTKDRLWLAEEPLTTYSVTAEDLDRISPVGKSWLAKSEQDALQHETIIELVAEKFASHENLIRRLNPNIVWTNVFSGTLLTVPNFVTPAFYSKAAFIRIELTNKILEAYDSQTNLLLHFPCSIARRVEKRPVGTLFVEVVARNPNYTWNPDLYPDTKEARTIARKLIIPPGPNNPVGTAWIGLDKPGYGIHGTPSPEKVGRTESLGCFRLANWNAETLLSIVLPGTPVYVVP